MRVLGLDLSLTACGWVVLDDNALPLPPTDPYVHAASSQSFPALKDLPRLLAYERWIHLLLAQHKPEHVAVEGYGFAAQSPMAFAMGELGGVVKLAILENDLEPKLVPPSHWKKQLLGKGNLKKDEVRLEVFKRYGIEFKSQDTLDAYCVAMSVWRELKGIDKIEPVKSKSKRKTRLELTAIDVEAEMGRRVAL